MCDHPEREAAMVRLSDKVWCDPCIAPLISALNEGGVPTVSSCCGHGRRPGRVSLADGREVIVARSADEASGLLGFFPGINDEPPRAAWVHARELCDSASVAGAQDFREVEK